MPRVEAWPEYVVRCSRNAAQKDIAYAVGVNQSTIGRWLAGGTPEVKHVVAFAKAYGRKPVEAFLAAGFLTPADISGPIQIGISIDDVPDEALIEGLASRLADLRGRIGDDRQDGLVPEGWGENPGVDRMQDRN